MKHSKLIAAISIAINSMAAATEITVNDNCSLADAIVSANTDNSGLTGCVQGDGIDIIVLPEASVINVSAVSENNPVLGNLGFPAITADVTIQGNDTTITDVSSANQSNFVLFGVDAAQVDFQDISVLNAAGAFILDNAAEVQLSDSVISGIGLNGGNGISGIAARNNSKIKIVGSTLSNNSFYGNIGEKALIMIDSSSLEIRSSTVSNNFSFDLGNIILESESNAAFINSTFSYNEGYQTGGISADNSLVDIVNSTFVDNKGVAFPYVTSTASDSLLFTQSNVTIVNSIVTDRCVVSRGSSDVNVSNSWIAEGSCSEPADTDFYVQRPYFLGPLADNGGKTKTHALSPKAKLIGAGNYTACVGGLVNGVDQRGNSRINDLNVCDIGAYDTGLLTPQYGTQLLVIPLAGNKAVIIPN